MKTTIIFLLPALAILGCEAPAALHQASTLLLECPRPRDWQPSLEMRIDWIAPTPYRSLETAHLAALLGPPDRKLTMTEFAALSVQDGSGIGLRGGKPVEEAYRIFEGQFGRYEVNTEDWQKSEVFLSYDIWLYAWETPQEITVGISGFPRREWDERRSYFALIDDGRLVDLGRILRPSEVP